MKTSEKGFTLIELLIASTIMALAAFAAGMAIYQVFGGTDDNNDRITAVHQVQNAGYWISRDVQMSLSINTTDELAFPYFLQLAWTEWDDEGSPIYHSANYTLENGGGNIYSLKRSYSSTSGIAVDITVADYIYYQPDSSYTSNTSYDNPIVILNLTSIYDDARESREYRIKRRAGL